MAKKQTTALTTKSASKPAIAVGSRGIQIDSIESLQRFANMLLASPGFLPKGMKNQADVCLAVELGLELGFTPLRSLQNIAVINGRPGIYGAASTALILQSGKCAGITEKWAGKEGEDDWTCIVEVRRTDIESPFVGRFSWGDAKRAGLVSKDTYQKYPADMLRWRATWRAYNGGFADVLMGLPFVEIAEDFGMIEAEAEVVHTAAPTDLDGLADQLEVDDEPEPEDPGQEAAREYARGPAQKAAEPEPEPEAPEVEPEPEPAAEPRTEREVLLSWESGLVPEPWGMPIPCNDLPPFEAWADDELPHSPLKKRHKTWRECTEGSQGGFRCKMLLEVINQARSEWQKLKQEPSGYQQKCAATLRTWLHLKEQAKAEAKAKPEPTPEELFS